MSAKRGLWVLLALLALGVVLAATAVLVLLPGFIARRIVERAALYGVDIQPGEVGFGLDWVQLEGSKLKFAGVNSLEATVARIDVSLAHFSPVSVALGGVELSGYGEPPKAALELRSYGRAHAAAFDLPLSASNVHIRFSRSAGAPPWFELAGGRVARQAAGSVFTADQATLAGVPLGRVGGSFGAQSAHAAFGFGESDLARAPVQLALEPGSAASKTRVTLTLSPIALERVTGALGVPPPAAAVTLSGTLDAIVDDSGQAAGTLHAALAGYVPPHPPELDGFVFGDATTFDSAFSLPASADRVVLRDSVLSAGRFALRGGGLVLFANDHSQLSLELAGDLACDALASAAVEARAGKLLGAAAGALLGSAARRAVQGSVSVRVTLSADSRDFAHAKLEPRIGVGCGLVPLPLDPLGKALPDLTQLKGLPPPDLSKLPALPRGLPALPSALPALPKGIPSVALPPLPSAPSKAQGSASPAASAKGR